MSNQPIVLWKGHDIHRGSQVLFTVQLQSGKAHFPLRLNSLVINNMLSV